MWWGILAGMLLFILWIVVAEVRALSRIKRRIESLKPSSNPPDERLLEFMQGVDDADALDDLGGDTTKEASTLPHHPPTVLPPKPQIPAGKNAPVAQSESRPSPHPVRPSPPHIRQVREDISAPLNTKKISDNVQFLWELWVVIFLLAGVVGIMLFAGGLSGDGDDKAVIVGIVVVSGSFLSAISGYLAYVLFRLLISLVESVQEIVKQGTRR